MSLVLPEKVWEHLKEFIDDQKTGNITLHVREGQVLGLKVEEQIKIADP